MRASILTERQTVSHGRAFASQNGADWQACTQIRLVTEQSGSSDRNTGIDLLGIPSTAQNPDEIIVRR